jgi:uncharacterized protein YjiK
MEATELSIGTRDDENEAYAYHETISCFNTDATSGKPMVLSAESRKINFQKFFFS